MNTNTALHDTFLTLLPQIERHARMFFRSTRCADKRQDQLAEVIALCWRWCLRLAERGKDVTRFPVVLAHYACRAVKNGRRLTGQERAREVMNPLAQQRHTFRVQSLPLAMRTAQDHLYGSVDGQRAHDEFEERLHDNTVTPVPDQAAFRIDYPAWLATLTAPERRLIRAMARDERTKDLSQQFAVSPGRISQLRREFHTSWQSFCGETISGQAIVAA